MASSALFLHPKYKPPPTPDKGIFDPELSLTIQDKHEREVREFQQAVSWLNSPRTHRNDCEKEPKLPDPKMRVFVSYGDETMAIDVAEGKKVRDVKDLVKTAFGIRPSQPARGGLETADTILCLNYSGADLDDGWVLSEIGVHPGSSLHAFLREEEQPTLHIYCVHNLDTIELLQKFKPTEMTVAEIRSMASKKSGLPVGVFRLVTATDRREMYDVNTLDKYDIMPGDTVHLETWDGWADFLNLSARGFTTHALAKLSSDELVARYQMKVALFLAAFNGHVDLAVALLRQGIRSDEPVGEHPYRQWCSNLSRHADSIKCPIHVAAEAGQFGIVRTFVHNNICCVMAKDGNGLRPLNLALRNKQKSCASFLLTKQWSRINFDQTSIPLSLYAKMRSWSVKAKEKALLLHGQEKSTLKRKTTTEGPLIGQGIYVDGFSDCIMSSRSKGSPLTDVFRCSGEPAHRDYLRDSDPESYFKNILYTKPKGVRASKFSRLLSKSLKPIEDVPDETTTRLPALPEKTVTRKISTSTISDPKDDKLPQINRKSDAESPISVFEQKEDDTDQGKKNRKKKDTQQDSQLLLLQAKTAEATIPLPLRSIETIPRPVFLPGALGKDLASGTMAQYEEYRGMKAKDYAIKCLSIASTFKERPWLQQVRMALTLTNISVKKKVAQKQRNKPTLGDELQIDTDAERVMTTSSTRETNHPSEQ